MAAAAVLVVSACAGVPSSSGAHSIEERGAAQAGIDRPYVRLLPPLPQPGYGPEAIADGFQVAMTDFTDGHAAARRYLTPAEARSWDPDARTVVYSNLQPITSAGASTGSFVYQVTPVAVISRDHGYSLDSVPEVYDVKAVRVTGGQWRLSYVKPGTLMSVADFDRAFRGVDIYFPAASGVVLVPDHVFLPVPPGDLPGAMVRQLVAGPTSWLAPAVHRVVPAGTTVQAVTVGADGTADVALGGAAETMTGNDRRLLLAALTWTLADQLPDVKAVHLAIGNRFIGGPVHLQDFSSFDPAAFPSGSRATYVDGGHVQQLQADGQGPQPGVSPALDGVSDPVAPVAARGLAGVRHRPNRPDELVIYADGRWRSVYSARRLSAPTWMPDGSAVWTTATLADGRQRVVAVRLPSTDSAAQADPIPVRVDLSGSQLRQLGAISQLRLSRDGTRVAFVLTEKGSGAAGARPYVARIDVGSGRPVLSGLRPIAPACPVADGQRCLTAVADLAWVDADHVVVLGNTAATDPGTRAPYIVSIDGSSVQSVATAGLSSNVISITAAPDVPMIAVVPGEGGEREIYLQTADSWVRVGNGSQVRYPD